MDLLVSFDQVVSAERRGLVQDQGVVCEGVVKRLPDARSLQTEGPHPQSACEEEAAVEASSAGSQQRGKRAKTYPCNPEWEL